MLYQNGFFFPVRISLSGSEGYEARPNKKMFRTYLQTLGEEFVYKLYRRSMNNYHRTGVPSVGINGPVSSRYAFVIDTIALTEIALVGFFC